MIESGRHLRELQKTAKKNLLDKKCERDEDGRVIISMNVSNDDAFLSPFSETDTPVIASDVADFIEESTNGTAYYEEYTLRIKSNCIDEREQGIYKNAIHAYFEKRYVQNEKEMNRNRIVSVICAFVGVLVLAIALLLEYKFNAVWAEFIDIVAWVLVWEAVYVELFENRKAKWRRYYYLACMTMKVEYVTE